MKLTGFLIMAVAWCLTGCPGRPSLSMSLGEVNRTELMWQEMGQMQLESARRQLEREVQLDLRKNHR